MTDDYKKGKFICDYLESLDTNLITIGEAIDDNNLERSYRLIKENPKITKEEFLEEMGIEEYVDPPIRIGKNGEVEILCELTDAQDSLINNMKNNFHITKNLGLTIALQLEDDESIRKMESFLENNPKCDFEQIIEIANSICEEEEAED